MVYACDNEQCRVLIYQRNATRAVSGHHCPLCWHLGRSLDNASIDELLCALDKRIPAEQLRLIP